MDYVYRGGMVVDTTVTDSEVTVSTGYLTDDDDDPTVTVDDVGFGDNDDELTLDLDFTTLI